MNDLMSSILIDLNDDEVRAPDVSQGLMDSEIVVWEEGKRGIECFLKDINFVTRISRTDTDQFNFAPQAWVRFNQVIELVHSGCYFLAFRAVYAENFNDDHFGFDLWYIERSAP